MVKRGRSGTRTSSRAKRGKLSSRSRSKFSPSSRVVKPRGFNPFQDELKYSDEKFNVVGTVFISTYETAVKGINALTVGAGYRGERVGNSVNLKSIQVDWSLTPAGNVITNQEPCFVRILVVHDSQTCGGSDPTYSDLIDLGNDEDAVVVVDNAIQKAIAPRKLDNRFRFTILRDKIIEYGNSTPAGDKQGGNVYMHGREYIKMKLNPVQFSGVGGTKVMTDIQSGGIWVFAYCSATTYGPQLNIKTRIRYVDP